jgi:hypothetical protein
MKIGQVTKVSDISQSEDMQFVSDSQDVAEVRNHILSEWVLDRQFKTGNLPYYWRRLNNLHMEETISEFDAYFVKIENGDYIEIYGIPGIIPFDEKNVTRLW